ncbi:membrane protein insertion efficiency factor YidD [Candidatus Collierbacteria bacterium]|nr:membrane protein insertion efficiency factor YidD [Candidatus Collierbacteria bacterium]
MLSKIFIFLIDAYQQFKRCLGLPSPCRFSPTCSEYVKQAIVRHGIIRGSVLGLNRIFRCHPWNSGGFDPVPK